MDQNQDNVRPLRPEYALFNARLRDRMAAGLRKDNTDGALHDAHQAVDTFEQVLCREIVSNIRTTAVRLADRAGTALGRKIMGG